MKKENIWIYKLNPFEGPNWWLIQSENESGESFKKERKERSEWEEELEQQN